MTSERMLYSLWPLFYTVSMDHSFASAGVTTVVWLLIAVMVVAVASKYIRVPYTVALVVAGLFITFTPLKVTINLTPDLILFIFLPALLFESAYNLLFSEVRENLRTIAFLAVPGVILTAVIMAVVVYYAAGVGWQTAFLFGAIMSATDPVSVLAIFRQLGAPRRLSVILEGESLFNDGTSLVIFRIVLGIVVAGTAFDPVATAGQFLFVVAGGLALGAIVGFVVSLLHTRVNDYLIETTMTVVVAYGTYLLAEWVGVSGVIAVVVAALVLGNYGRATAMSPTTRLAVSSTWDFFGFLANSLIFLLIGLELNIERLNQFWVPTVMAIVAVLVVRVLVVMFSGAVLRYIHKPIPFNWQSVLVWGGLRGSLALAMALSLPFAIAPSSPFPNRDLIQVMTFGVILFSLLVQGLTVEPLLRRLGLIRASDWQQEYETIRVRRGMAVAALSEIEKWSRSGSLSPDVAEELRQNYSEELGSLDQSLRDLHFRDEDLRHSQLRAARRRLVQLEKTIVQQRYLDGTISEEARRRLIEELDSQMYNLESDFIPEDPEKNDQGEVKEPVVTKAAAGDVEQPHG